MWRVPTRFSGSMPSATSPIGPRRPPECTELAQKPSAGMPGQQHQCDFADQRSGGYHPHVMVFGLVEMDTVRAVELGPRRQEIALRRPFERKVKRELIRPGIGNARVGGADEMPQIVEVKNCRYADCGAAVVSRGTGSLAKTSTPRARLLRTCRCSAMP